MEETAQLALVESQPLLPPVLSIYEILHLIFRELRSSDCVRAALVCRAWLDPALDCIWKDLYEVHPLLLLLGPIDFGANTWDWDIGFPQADWARFQSYSRRVHSISYDGGWYEGCGFALEHMNPEVPVKLLYYVAMNQGAYVLPRAQAIHWDATEDRELQLLISLISPSINEFDLDVWGCTVGASSRLLKALRFILPRDLRIFRFRSDLDKTPGEDVIAIIRQQDSLQTLKLPSCALDPVMFKPKLRSLEAYCTVDSQQVLGALVEACPHLKEVRLIFSGECNLTFDSISPLLHCPKLINVDLDCPGRCNPEESDIKAMGNAWPELESLNLCCTRDYPGLESSHGMSMRMLPTLARYLSPKLRRLALFLNTTDVPLPLHEATPFSNLEVFAVGNSPLDSEMAISAVAAYLDALLPPKVEQIYSNSMARQSGSVFEPIMPRFRQNRAWESVEKLFSKLR